MNTSNIAIQATYTEGVLKPTRPLDLPEGARVSLTIETVRSTETNQKRSPTQILEAIASMPLENAEQNFSNRNHDQVIY